QCDELLAVDEQRRGMAPDRVVALVDLVQFLLPDDRALVGVEAEQMSHRAECVNPAIFDDRRGAWAGRVAQLDIGTVVRMMPDFFPRLRVEAEDALLAGHRRAAEGGVLVFERGFVGFAVHDVEPVADDRGAGVAGADRLPPAELRSALGELVENALFAPDRVALWAEPLRPVVAAGGDGAE